MPMWIQRHRGNGTRTSSGMRFTYGADYMQGRVTIYVDSDLVTSFEGELEAWKHKINFEIPRKPQMQLSLGDTPEPQLTPLKTITLNLEAMLHGNIMGYPYICLFYYNYDNPTQKQIELDVEIATGQMRNIL